MPKKANQFEKNVNGLNGNSSNNNNNSNYIW